MAPDGDALTPLAVGSREMPRDRKVRRRSDENVGRALRPRLLHGSSWNFAAQVTPIGINIVLTPYLIHGLGLDQYSLYALAATITIFLASFDGGIGSTAPRFLSVYAATDDRRSSTRLLCSLAAIILACGGALSVGDWLVSPLFAELFRMPHRFRPESVFLLRTFGILITVSLLHSLFVSLLQARQRFGITSKATIASYLAWAAGLWVTVHAHYGLRGIALSLIAEQLLATLIIIPTALRYLEGGRHRFAPRAELRRFFSFAARVQATGVSALVNMEFDALVIGVVLPVRNVGLYNAGANVSTQARYAATSLLPPLSNHLATTFGRHGGEEARAEMARLQRIWVVIVAGFSAAGLGAAYFGVIAWLGPRFRLSALVCTILLAGYAINLLTGIMTSYVAAVGRPGLETRYGVLGLVINVVLTVPLAFLGVLGIVGATAVGTAIASAYFLRIVHRHLSSDVPSFFRDIPVLRCLLCMAVTAGLELLLKPWTPRGPLGLLACGIPPLLGLTSYGLTLLGVRRSLRVLRRALSGTSPLDLITLR